MKEDKKDGCMPYFIIVFVIVAPILMITFDIIDIKNGYTGGGTEETLTALLVIVALIAAMGVASNRRN